MRARQDGDKGGLTGGPGSRAPAPTWIGAVHKIAARSLPNWLRGVACLPYDMLRIRVTVAGCLGQQASFDPEVEQHVGVGRRLDLEPRTFIDELLRKLRAHGSIVDERCAASHIEGIFVVGARKRVHSELTVTAKILLLQRGDDEGIHSILGEQRAHGMDAGPPVLSDRSEEGKANPVLVQQCLAGVREISSLAGELSPCGHGGKTLRGNLFGEPPDGVPDERVPSQFRRKPKTSESQQQTVQGRSAAQSRYPR
jgi:hypothetical protein